nr:hypothetical protein CFP56_60847 [Quercus suber]
MMDVVHTMAEVTTVRSQVTAEMAAENPGKSGWVIIETSFAEKLQEIDDVIGDDVSLTADFSEMESTKENGETAEIKFQNLEGRSAYKNVQVGRTERGALENKEGEVAHSGVGNGKWKRTQRDQSNNLGVEEHANKEGPKRKTLGEMDQNIPQEKRLKMEIDEVCLANLFKQNFGSAEVAQ